MAQEQQKEPPKQNISGAPKEFDPTATVDNMDTFYKAVSYSKRQKAAYPVFVTDDVFDIVTDGETKAPLFWKGDGTATGNAVPIIPKSREKQGLELYGCKKQYPVVTIG